SSRCPSESPPTGGSAPGPIPWSRIRGPPFLVPGPGVLTTLPGPLGLGRSSPAYGFRFDPVHTVAGLRHRTHLLWTRMLSRPQQMLRSPMGSTDGQLAVDTWTGSTRASARAGANAR